MGYLPSKATAGLCEAPIALMPPHSVCIESHLGSGELMTHKPPAVRSIGIDRDAHSRIWAPRRENPLHPSPDSRHAASDARWSTALIIDMSTSRRVTAS